MSTIARVATADDRFLVKLEPFVYEAKEALKNIDGRDYKGEIKCWAYPVTPASAATIYEVLRGQNVPVHGDQTFIDQLTMFQHAKKLLTGATAPHKPKFQTDVPRFEHQKLGYSLIETLPGVYLGHEMGCCKTRIGIDAACSLGMKRVLIVCPKSVIIEWPRQFEEHGDGSVVCVALVKSWWPVARRAKEIEKALKTHKRVAIVTNYDGIWRWPLGPQVKKTKKNRRIIIKRGLALSTRWDMVIADEIHRIKESRNNVGWFFQQLRHVAKRRVGMSGTPIPNTPLDLWSQMLFLDSGVFGESFVQFRKTYAIMGGFKGRQVLNFRNLDKMSRRFYMVSHRVTKKEALDLPPEIDEEKSVELGAEAKRIYQDLEESFMARVRDGEITVAHALTEMLRLQQLTGGFVKLDTGEGIVIDEAKAGVLKEVLSDLPSKEPVVIFCRFHHDLQAIAKVAEDLGRGYAELSRRSGRPSEALEKWQEAAEGELPIFGVQVQSGGLGINLARSSYAIFYSLGFSPGEHLQACSRVHRQGQERKVTYIHLITRGCSTTGRSIDERVYATLKRKRETNEKALMGTQGEEEVVRQIMQEMIAESS